VRRRTSGGSNWCIWKPAKLVITKASEIEIRKKPDRQQREMKYEPVKREYLQLIEINYL